MDKITNRHQHHDYCSCHQSERPTVKLTMQPTSKSTLPIKMKRPGLSFQDRSLSWDKSQSPYCPSVQESLLAKGIKTIPHTPYSLDIAPPDFILFTKVKSELAGSFAVPGQLQDKLGRDLVDHRQRRVYTIFQQWYEHCEKCVCIGDVYV
jgi:hypothetical protein